MNTLSSFPETLVYTDRGRPVTKSMAVAAIFDKRHSAVIKAVEQIAAGGNGGEFLRVSSRETPAARKQGYLITKDGFARLTAGYSGKNAVWVKKAYLAAFDREARRGIPAAADNGESTTMTIIRATLKHDPAITPETAACILQFIGETIKKHR